MTTQLFGRLKNLVKKEGKVVFVNENTEEIFVLLSLDEYEESVSAKPTASLESQEFPAVSASADKELMRQVNEDMALWRNEEKAEESVPAQRKDSSGGLGDLALEEERFYLEPLE